MKRWMVIGVGLVLMLIAVATVAAQTGGGYELTWSTMDGGGGATSSGPYALTGTIGQPDASVMSGGAYALAGGFWPGITSDSKLYLPLIQR